MQIVNWPRAFAFPIALRLSPTKRQRGVNLPLNLPLPLRLSCFIIMFWVFLSGCVFFLSCNYIEHISESADTFVSHCDSVLLRIVNILFVQLTAGTRPKGRGQGQRGGGGASLIDEFRF